jgi:hypothetical protein
MAAPLLIRYRPSVFTAPTYIVLDLPPAVGAEVIALRSRYDAFEAQLPPEITVAGSSGVGVLAEQQDAEHVFQAIQHVGQQHLPFVSAFVSMERIPRQEFVLAKLGVYQLVEGRASLLRSFSFPACDSTSGIKRPVSSQS